MEKRHIINLQGRDFRRELLEALVHPSPTIEKGYCQCGCGAQANIAARNEYRRGFVRGEPIPNLPGHNRRKTSPRYVEEHRGYKTPCWIWQSVNRSVGYGQVSVDGVNLLAHRLMFVLYRGDVPEGLVLDHLCRQRSCVHPHHLEAVSQNENVFRMYAAQAAEALARELEAGGGVYTDIFALEGMKVKRINAHEPRLGDLAESGT